MFSAYAAPHEHALIDRELYIPESWTSDRGRCHDAEIPARSSTTNGTQSRTPRRRDYAG